ncbi:MAG: DNA primase small subunit domain-containing protein [Nitrososphaera sp.]
MTQDKSRDILQFLRSAFREYYFRGFSKFELPSMLQQREFGFTGFGSPGMKRHLSFGSAGELQAYLVREVPSDIYCSNSCYLHPTQPMDQKGWISASLIFDIDGKDLNLPCVESHTYTHCTACDTFQETPSGEKADQACVSCSGGRIEKVSIPCSKCIGGSLAHVRRLTDFLTGEFGFSEDDIAVYFSGNNGFHVHLSGGQDFETLDSRARMEIAGYISATGLMPEVLGVRKSKRDERGFIVRQSAPEMQYGWAARINALLKVVKASSKETTHRITDLGGYEGLKTRVEEAANKQRAIIDPQVTSDIHRIFRLPGSINSKSSLAKVRCDNLSDFDPFTKACVIGDAKIGIQVRAPVKLKLKGMSFKLGKEKAEVPAFAACYLICKGLATLEA